MEGIMDKLRNTKILGIIGNVLVIISLFMPVLVLESEVIGYRESWQYINSDGKILLALSIINLVIIFADKISPEFFKGFTNIKITAIPSIIEVIVLINFTAKRGDIVIGNQYVDLKWSIGFYVMWIGVILSMLCPIIYREKNKEQLENSSKEETK